MTFTSAVAPIANIYIARNGYVWIMAAGATNTNGRGTAPWIPGWLPDNTMNSHAISIEIGNNGVGEPYGAHQQESTRQTAAALAHHYNIPVDRVRAHFEWSPGRKIDPSGPSRWASHGKWNMPSFRHSVTLAIQDHNQETPPDMNFDKGFLWRYDGPNATGAVYWISNASVAHIDGNARDMLLEAGCDYIVSDNLDVARSYERIARGL